MNNKSFLNKVISHGEEDATVVPEAWECVVCSEACVEEVDLVATDPETAQVAVVVSEVMVPDTALLMVCPSIKKLSPPK